MYWLILLIGIIIGCSEIPDISLETNPELPSVQLVLAHEGIGISNADYQLNYNSLEYDLELFMMRDAVEAVLGNPSDSTLSDYSYQQEDALYRIYYDDTKQVRIIELYSDRAVSLTSDFSYGIAVGEKRDHIAELFGTAQESTLTMMSYSDRGVGFIIDHLSQKVEGISLSPPEIALIPGIGTKDVYTQMENDSLELILGNALSITGSIFSYRKGGFYYDIQYVTDSVSLMTVSPVKHGIAYIEDNGIRMGVGDSREFIKSKWGEADSETESYLWYYEKETGFYFGLGNSVLEITVFNSGLLLK